MFAYEYPSVTDVEKTVDGRGIQKDGHQGVSSTATKFGESLRGLFCWHKSFFKLVWKQALVYYFVYVSVTLVYTYGLTEPKQKENFEALAREVGKYTNSLPVVLLLGFFTSAALNRWFVINSNMPGTSRPITAFIVSLSPDAADGSLRLDFYIRYVLLVWLLTFRSVSGALRKRYPNLMVIQKCGLLLEHERRILEKHRDSSPSGKTTLPLVAFDWLNIIIKDTAKKGYFGAPADTARNTDQVQMLKKNCGAILRFASKNIPLALIQAVTIAIYCHGFFSIMSHTVRPEASENTRFFMTLLTGYFPIPYALTYFFYYAWFKVGRIATDPFGDDEDDIDIPALFQSHIDDALRLRQTYGQTFESLVKDVIPN